MRSKIKGVTHAIWYPSLYLQYRLGGNRLLTKVGGCVIMSLMYKPWGTCTHNTTILPDNAESCVKFSLMYKPWGIWQITQKDCVNNWVIKLVPCVQAVRDCTITQKLCRITQKIVLRFALMACTWHDNAENCVKLSLTACTWGETWHNILCYHSVLLDYWVIVQSLTACTWGTW